MVKQKDIWKYYDDWKVHITDNQLMEKICQNFNLMNQIDNCTRYYDKNFSNPIGWDIVVPNDKLEEVKKSIEDNT